MTKKAKIPQTVERFGHSGLALVNYLMDLPPAQELSIATRGEEISQRVEAMRKAAANPPYRRVPVAQTIEQIHQLRETYAQLQAIHRDLMARSVSMNPIYRRSNALQQQVRNDVYLLLTTLGLDVDTCTPAALAEYMDTARGFGTWSSLG